MTGVEKRGKDMYKKYSLDELIEMEQDGSDEAETNQIREELAKRFREGIDVEKDDEEADYWESRISSRAVDEDNVPAHPVSNDTGKKDNSTEETYKEMSDSELFRAYRNKEPWGIYCFSTKLIANGEYSSAIESLQELETVLKNSLSSGNYNNDTIRLLAMVKIQLGGIYLRSQGEQSVVARNYYEEAVLELGFHSALTNLMELYKASGTLKANEPRIVPILKQIENGNAENKYAAAQAYEMLGRKVYALSLCQEILEMTDCPVTTRSDSMNKLVQAMKIDIGMLEPMSKDGDGAATLALTMLYCANNRFAEARNLLDLCVEQSPELREKARAQRHCLEWLESENDKKREGTAENQIIDGEQEKSPKRESGMSFISDIAEFVVGFPFKCRQIFEKAKTWSFMNPIKAVVSGVITLALIFCVLFTVISLSVNGSQRTDSAIEKIDAFEDIEVRCTGVGPNGKIELINNSPYVFLQTATYTVSEEDGLSNGDKVTIKLDYDRSMAKEEGVTPEKTSMVYEVSGLQYYVTEPSQIDAACIAAMEQQARDMVEAQIAGYSGQRNLGLIQEATGELWHMSGNYGEYGEITQLESYFLSSKQIETVTNQNMYIFTYEMPVVVKWGEAIDYEGQVCFCAVFYDVTVDTQGNCKYDKCSMKSPVDNIEALYSNQVSAHKDLYYVYEIPAEQVDESVVE